MKKSSIPKATLQDFTAFAAVADHRSFRKAADALGVSRSALSHTLINLERSLGVRLLNRTTRSVSPTDAGSRLLERIAPVLREGDAARDGLADVRGEPGGARRINANTSGARWLLDRVVPAFLARYPSVELDLVIEGQLVDVVKQGFDAGVRLAESVPQDMVAIPVGGDVRFVAVASPAYLKKREPPVAPADLQNHACIRQRLPSGKRYRWEFSRHGNEMSVDVPGALTLDDNDLMVRAAADGLGIAYVPEPFARERLKSRKLVLVLEDWCPPIAGLMLYYPRNRYVPSALRAFIDLVKAANRGAEA
ncbi:MAG: putative transcriptional regulatory proteinLysR family [Lacunisphaera sp.]|nr:putative transcriptional regulatory proteinLysR family [Lacunisphaera sp.]